MKGNKGPYNTPPVKLMKDLFGKVEPRRRGRYRTNFPGIYGLIPFFVSLFILSLYIGGKRYMPMLVEPEVIYGLIKFEEHLPFLKIDDSALSFTGKLKLFSPLFLLHFFGKSQPTERRQGFQKEKLFLLFISQRSPVNTGLPYPGIVEY